VTVWALLFGLGTLALGGLAYLLDLRINRSVSWSAEQVRTQHKVSVVVTNTGISKAGQVVVELDGSPSLDHDATPVDVDSGARVIVDYHLAMGARAPQNVTVRWARRLRRNGVWTTPI